MNVKELLTRDITLEKPKRWFMGLKLPLLFLAFMVTYWLWITNLVVQEENYKQYGEPYVADAVEHMGTMYIRVPVTYGYFETYEKYEVDPELVEDGKVTVYYIEKERRWHIPKLTSEWIPWRVLGLIMSIVALYWVAIVLYDKYKVAKLKKSCGKCN